MWNVPQHTPNNKHWNMCHKALSRPPIGHRFPRKKRRRNSNCSSPCRALALTAVGDIELTRGKKQKSGAAGGTAVATAQQGPSGALGHPLH